MALVDEIVLHRDEILADLDCVHDYYTNTKFAWRIVQRYIDRGGKAKIHNLSTGHVTTEIDLPGKAQSYITEYLIVSTFLQFVSLFEDFIFGLMKRWLLAYPQPLARKQLQFSVILEAADCRT